MLQAGDLNSMRLRLPTAEQRMVFEASVAEVMRGKRQFSISLECAKPGQAEDSYRAILSAARNFSYAARGLRELAGQNSNDGALSRELLRKAERVSSMESRAAMIEMFKRPGIFRQ